MTTKKATQETENQSEVVNDTKPDLDLKAMYEQLLAQQEAIRAAAKSAGIQLEEPPTGDAVVAYKDSVPSRAIRPGEQEPDSENWRPWTKADLDRNPDEKYSFVPQFIPGLVHPLLDELRRPRIILDVNGLKCCLTVGVLNENISGMFYHAYKNAEEGYANSETFKLRGPETGAPWVHGGTGGTNTWHYEPEVPSAWITLDGAYYKPGAVMPGSESEE